MIEVQARVPMGTVPGQKEQRVFRRNLSDLCPLKVKLKEGGPRESLESNDSSIPLTALARAGTRHIAFSDARHEVEAGIIEIDEEGLFVMHVPVDLPAQHVLSKHPVVRGFDGAFGFALCEGH